MLRCSTVAGATGVPRRNSSAVIGCLPARCNSTSAHGAAAAGDGQLVVEHASRRPVAVAFGRAQNFDAPGAGKLAPGAGKRRQPAAMVVDFVPRLRPIDARFALVDLVGVGHAALRLAASVATAPFSSAASARSIRSAPSRASSSCSSPVVASAPIGDALGHGDRRRCRGLPPSSSPSRRSLCRRP